MLTECSRMLTPLPLPLPLPLPFPLPLPLPLPFPLPLPSLPSDRARRADLGGDVRSRSLHRGPAARLGNGSGNGSGSGSGGGGGFGGLCFERDSLAIAGADRESQLDGR